VNTVVTRHNSGERLIGVITRIGPERWKVMRALRIEGENDRDFGDLEATDRQFARFLAVNREVPAGTVRVPENNEDMIASYVMVDPAGRFVDNAAGRYRVSAPILRAGVEAAYRQVTHDPDTFKRRGGRYEW
jgi:radical S-adenosyl methionine domain-containing protein 2